MNTRERVAKLKDLEAMGSCNACGAVSWEPQAAAAWISLPLGPAPVLADPAAAYREEGFPCLVLLCNHCGCVRLHSTEMLEKR